MAPQPDFIGEWADLNLNSNLQSVVYLILVSVVMFLQFHLTVFFTTQRLENTGKEMSKRKLCEYKRK
jgi:hypothetical protein